MKLRLLAISILILSSLLLSGCRTAPIYNVSDAPIPSWQDKALTQEDIADAIRRAGVSLNWIMQKKGDGHIQGTLNLRSHTAVVDIYYDESKFSIIYNDSKNLLHNGNYIHNNYNNWVKNLASGINIQISQL